MEARRKALKGVAKGSSTHAGLWLDKFLTDQPEDGQKTGKKDEQAAKAKAALVKELGEIDVPDGYTEAFQRRKELFDKLALRHQAKCCPAEVEGRMIIGLGQKGPTEAGLALEHTWGVPMIPGSALKGLTMAAAHLLLEDEAWRKKSDGRGRSLALLGGTTEHIGRVIFHDAWWIPNHHDRQEKLPIHPDVITVHHPDYYKDGKRAPSDMDNPIPNAFASVNGAYFVVVEVTSPLKQQDKDEPESETLLDAALCILKLGLTHLGIGAKTNAGYGRMKLDFESEAERKQKAEDEAAKQQEQQRKEQEEAQQKAEQRRQLAQRDAEKELRTVVIQNAAQAVPRLLAPFDDPAERSAFAERIVAQLNKKVVMAKAKESKPWAVALLNAAGIEV